MFHPETDWLRRWALYTPDRFFLRDHETSREWSFARASGCADAVAAWLTDELGLSTGDRLALLSTNRAEMVFLFFAAQRLGAILVPLNFRLTARELSGLVDDCGPRAILFEAGLSSTARSIESPEESFALRAIEDVEPLLDVRPSAVPPGSPSPADLDQAAMILYTSGTTGVPKGAIITHRMLLWNAINTGLRLDIDSHDHTQSYAPFFHTGGWNVLFTPFLLHGASHTLMKGFDPELVLELMEQERTTLVFGVPTMLQMMADTEAFDRVDLSRVRYAIVGGAPMPLPLIDRWHDKGVAIRQGYGLTEVGPNCFSLNEEDAVSRRGSIGRPNFFLDVRIVRDDGRDCDDDEVGELWLRGETVTPGYWERPEATAEAIVDGWFRTGDLVRRDAEGFHYVVDRKKNMFISGGENVYPAEVERCLAEHGSVRDVAVLGVADPKWGEVGHAFCVLRSGTSLDVEGLRSYCDGRLARYKIPRYLTVVEEIPRNAAGKIDAAKLRSMV